MSPALAKSQGRFKNFENASADILRDNDILLLADSWHFDADLRAPLADDNYLEVLSENGVTDIYLEMRQDYQPAVQSFAASINPGLWPNEGGLSRELLISYIIEQERKNLDPKSGKDDPVEGYFFKIVDYMVDTIEKAARKNIRVHFADPQPIPEVQQLDTLLAGSVAVQARVNAGEAPDAYDLKWIEQTNEAFTHRMMYDPLVARNIVDTKRGKAVVFYGAMHFFMGIESSNYKKTSNIDDALRVLGQKAEKIYLHNLTDLADGTKSLDYFFQQNVAVFHQNYQRPDRIYQPSADKFHAFVGQNDLIDRLRNAVNPN